MTTTFTTGCYESVGKLKISRNSKKTHIYYQRESASLYIGDLSFDVKENDILEIFSKMSGLLSVRICRDVISEKSLGYGYINFQSKKYAKRAMKKMNFYFDKNSFKKPLRLMWKEKDKTLRISGKGNIFVNHLPYDYKTIDLYKLFLPFGKILSCKICYDSEGNSKRFGFVHFYLSKNAREAIRKLNESLLKGKKLHLSPFIKKETRDFLLPKNMNFTNIYIKKIDPGKLNDTDIRNMFEVFGEITSIMIPTEMGKPKGFAFVNFASHLDAEDAVLKMNGKKIGNFSLYVSKAQTKLERLSILDNTWNYKKKLLKGAQKKIFFIVKGMMGVKYLTFLIFLFLFLGNFGKYKILKLSKNEFSFLFNITVKKKKRLLVLIKKEHQFILEKFLSRFSEFFRKKNYKGQISSNYDKNNHLIESKKFGIKFFKNNKCFKFKDKKNKRLVCNKFKLIVLKKNLNLDFKKSIYFWFEFTKKKNFVVLFKFLELFYKKFLKTFIFSLEKNKISIEIPRKIW